MHPRLQPDSAWLHLDRTPTQLLPLPAHVPMYLRPTLTTARRPSWGLCGGRCRRDGVHLLPCAAEGSAFARGLPRDDSCPIRLARVQSPLCRNSIHTVAAKPHWWHICCTSTLSPVACIPTPSSCNVCAPMHPPCPSYSSSPSFILTLLLSHQPALVLGGLWGGDATDAEARTGWRADGGDGADAGGVCRRLHRPRH